jgi:hypothetical protein
MFYFISYLGCIKVYYNILLSLMLVFWTIFQFKYTYVSNMTKYFLFSYFLCPNIFIITISIIIIIVFMCLYANVLLMVYILLFILFFCFCILILCLTSVDVLYVWSGYVKDGLLFPFVSNFVFFVAFCALMKPLWLYSTMDEGSKG